MTVHASVPTRGPSSRPEGYDLHVHTTHSDGRCSPAEVVIAAHAVGLQGLAITDHDSISGLTSARREAARLAIDLVSGIELTAADVSGREFHLLGYFFRDDDQDLGRKLENTRQHLAQRSREIADRLRHLGYRVDLEAVARRCPRSQPGRRHFAHWLVQTGQLCSPRLAFVGMMEQGGPAFVAKQCPSLEQGIALLHDAGAAVALAHPPRDLGLPRLTELREQGLDAVEVRWPGLPASRSSRLERLAVQLDLVPLAGTDFHEPAPNARWVGLLTTPAARVQALKRRAASRDHSATLAPESFPSRPPTTSLP